MAKRGLLMDIARLRILLVASHGGHLRELLDGVEGVVGEHHVATCRTPHTEVVLRGRPHTFLVDPHLSILKYGINAIQSILLVARVRPQVVISTGAGIAIPTILFAKYLNGAKIIFIESAANVVSLSRTGAFCRRFADLFMVQWQDQLRNAPDAVCVGLL